MNILKIHKQALEADLDPLVSAYSFVKQLERYSRELKDLGQEAVADEGVDAVRILSIHRAKGLDFPSTYVGLTDYGAIGYRDKLDLRHDWRTDTSALRLDRFTEANYLRMEYMERSAFGKPRRTPRDSDFVLNLSEEECRVLYVAATRAKHDLCFTLAGDDPRNAGKEIMDFLETIHEGVEALTDKGEPWLPSEDLRKRSEKISLDPVIAGWNAIESSRMRWALPRITSITAEASSPSLADAEVASSPGLAEMGSEGQASVLFTTPLRTEFEEEQPETSFEFVSMQARLIGLLCHGVLERIEFKTPGNFRSLLELEKAKLTDAHPLQSLNAAETEAEWILERFLYSDAARWIASLEILGREVPVCVFDAKQNKVLTGTIDLLARNPSDQHYLIDYKTVDEVDPDSMAVYHRQMELYSRALSVSCAGRLCLLRSGKIIELF